MNLQIIKANAGTGKTYTLAMEYIKSILEYNKSSDILLITFTVKATLEIKSRVLQILGKANKKDENVIQNIEKYIGRSLNEEDFKLLKETLHTVNVNNSNLRISTIDSLMQRIFNYYIKSNKNIFNYETLINEDKNIYEKILKNIFESDIKDIFLFLITELSNKTVSEDVKSFLEEVLNKRIILEENINNGINEDLKKKKEHLLDKVYDKYQKMYSLYTDLNYSVKLLAAFNDETNYKIDSKMNVINKFNKFYKNLNNKKRLIYSSKLKVELEDKIIEIAEDIKKNIEDYFNSLKKVLIYVSNEIFNIYDEISLESKKFSLSYINTYVYNNIKQNVNVENSFFEYIGGKVKKIYIDEFQDTSISQVTNLLPIIISSNDLICVGDIKQSIYGFRGANYKIFNNLYNLLSKYTDVKLEEKVLNISYRSRKAIVDFVNIKMKERIKEKEIDYEYIDSSSIYEDDLENLGYVENVKATETRIFNSIKDTLLTFEKNDLNNTAIIVRKNNDAYKISNYLTINNIKNYIAKDVLLINMPFIKSFHYLLQYFLEKNVIYLLQHLRSDNVLYSQKQLSLIYDNLDNLKSIKEEDDKYIHDILNLKSALSKTKEQRDFNLFRWYLTNCPHKLEITEEVIKNFEYYEFLYLKYPNVYDLIERLNIQDITDTNSIRKINFKNEGVKILTIHSSKGLQYSTVMYIEGFNSNNKEKLKIFADYNFEESRYNEIILKTDQYSIYENLEGIKTLDEIENINNFYVALTRAKNNLYYYKKIKENKNSKDNIECEKNNNFLSEKEAEKVSKSVNMELYKEKNILYNKNSIDVFKKADIKSEFKRKKGLAIHEFLRHMKKLEDYSFSYNKVLGKYANLISLTSLKEVEDVVNQIINTYPEIFDGTYIFTEYEVYDGDHKYIIDRLNVDEKNKTIKIYDYKTGTHGEDTPEYQKQINLYKEIIHKKYPEYEVTTKILHISRGDENGKT